MMKLERKGRGHAKEVAVEFSNNLTAYRRVNEFAIELPPGRDDPAAAAYALRMNRREAKRIIKTLSTLLHEQDVERAKGDPALAQALPEDEPEDDEPEAPEARRTAPEPSLGPHQRLVAMPANAELPRRRGRPRKVVVVLDQAPQPQPAPAPRRPRGRPRKNG